MCNSVLFVFKKNLYGFIELLNIQLHSCNILLFEKNMLLLQAKIKR